MKILNATFLWKEFFRIAVLKFSWRSFYLTKLWCKVKEKEFKPKMFAEALSEIHIELCRVEDQLLTTSAFLKEILQ